MGTVLSNKVTFLDNKSQSEDVRTENSLKKQSVIISALPFKRFITGSAKNKSLKKVTPNPPLPPATSNGQAVEHLNHENFTKSQQSTNSDGKATNGPLAVPITTVPTQLQTNPDQEQSSPKAKQLVSVQKQPSSLSLISPRHVIVQASTGELLHCLGEFTCKRCFRLKELTPNEVINWFRNVDRTLLLQGWQDQGFITPPNLVFVYLLCREMLTDDIDNQLEVQGMFLTCLYLAYSYIGNEISYPLKPFMVETNVDLFWDRALDVIDKLSGKMLQINMDPHFFTEVFQDLKNAGDYKTDLGKLDR